MTHAWGLLIHVGPWKTGTKSVQSGLASMGAMLAAHRIFSPAGDWQPGAHHTFARAMGRVCTGSHNVATGPVYNGTGELHAACWTSACLPAEEAAFRAALLEPSQHVILSSEAFGNVNPACPRFIETFRAFDFVRVVVVYRNAASYSLSEHAQRIAEGSGRALHWQPFAFPNQTMQMSVEADCLTRLNYFAKVTRSWSDAFGRSSLSVLDLDGLAAGGMDPASAVVRAGFYQLGFPQLRAQERHNAGAAQHGMFLPLRQLLIEVLQADPVCNFSPRLPVNQRLLHNVSMQHWNSADPSAYFTKSLPKSMPVDCSHRLSQQCRSAATKQAQDFYAQLDVMGVERHFFNASATLSAAASTELPCELDREALRQEEIAIWRPWMCSELLHMSVH
tara:strand:- start:257 stop:1429 length:1173 start_codon:yes stop_codon:yes gene_type:complete